MIQTPATYIDWRALLAARGVTHPSRAHRLGLVQIAMGRAWAFRPSPDAPPTAIAGIVRDGDEAEAWFSPGPASSDHMLALVRAFRRQLDDEQRLEGGMMVARTARGNPAGERLVRLLGFVEAERDRSETTWRR